MFRYFSIAVLVACGAPAAKPAVARRAVAVAPAPVRVAAASPAPAGACADLAGDLAVPDDATTIDPAGVTRAIDGHRGELRRCYERYLKRDAHAGRVLAVFSVRGDGSVAQVQMRGFADDLDRCLCGIVAKTQFPAPHGTAIVAYPMQFTGTM